MSSWNLAEQSFKAPTVPGVYEAATTNKSYYLSVLLDYREKSLVDVESFKITHENDQGVEVGKTVYDQLWFWLALFALILLILEWEVYRRGR